jgi:predicted methyltransferase
MYKYLMVALLVVANSLVVTAATPDAVDSARLSAALEAQVDKRKARYQWRHPQETLEFFGITPGMTVVEVLPGGGWYSSILVSYLGTEGVLVGADYPMEMWPNFPFGTEEFIAKRRAWVEEWQQRATAWAGDDGASARAVRIGMIPDGMDGTADAALFIRALHNLNRFEDKGGFLSSALADTLAVLKPGGLVGVVQHKAPAGRSDEWADGSRGYLNQSALIARFEAAGFEYLDSSEINLNPADVPTEDEVVWRLPPSLQMSKNNPELTAKYEAIGESNRMTLLFRKPPGRKPATGLLGN